MTSVINSQEQLLLPDDLGKRETDANHPQTLPKGSRSGNEEPSSINRPSIITNNQGKTVNEEANNQYCSPPPGGININAILNIVAN